MSGPGGAGGSAAAAPGVRADAWELFGRLYLEGVGDGLAGALAGVPELGSALGPDFDADEAAAEHHRLFGLEVFPYGGAFLSGDGMASDPLGDSLLLLAALDREGDAGRVRALLGGHLLWWLPVFAHSALRQADRFWFAVLELTVALAVDHAGAVGVDPAGAPPGALGERPRSPLEDESAGLARVASWLVTPARSGVFLASSDLRRLGRALELPTGFGSRDRMAEALLRSAVEYGALAPVTAGLRELAAAEREFLVGAVPEGFAAPWLDRLDVLDDVLTELEATG